MSKTDGQNMAPSHNHLRDKESPVAWHVAHQTSHNITNTKPRAK
jgi:hypothetical protein